MSRLAVRITRRRTLLLLGKLDIMSAFLDPFDSGVLCILFGRSHLLAVDNFFDGNLLLLDFLTLDRKTGNRSGKTGLRLLILLLRLTVINDDITGSFIVQLLPVRTGNFCFLAADHAKQIITQLLAVDCGDRAAFSDGDSTGLLGYNDRNRISDFRDTDRRTVTRAVL